jgi:hypothetical protein
MLSWLVQISTPISKVFWNTFSCSVLTMIKCFCLLMKCHSFFLWKKNYCNAMMLGYMNISWMSHQHMLVSNRKELLPFQNVGRLGFFRYIDFAMHLNIGLCLDSRYMGCRIYVSKSQNNLHFEVDGVQFCLSGYFWWIATGSFLACPELPTILQDHWPLW